MQPKDLINDLLTLREKEVLNLVSTGLTIKEIAQELHVSMHTVVSHRKNMLQKVQAKNMVELVSIGFKSQLLSI